MQVAGHSAVLQKKAGDADAAVFPDIRVNGAVLPQSQIHFQIGKAGGQIPEVDLHSGFTETVEGVQRIRSEMAANHSYFHAPVLFESKWICRRPPAVRQGSWRCARFRAWRTGIVINRRAMA